MIIELTASELRRFEASIDRSGDCHVWAGSDKHPFGYGIFCLYRNGRRRTHKYLTHRLAYALAHGSWPTGQVVRHSCDNPPCVNPDHLLVGTQAQNMADALDRNRMDFSGLTADVLHYCRRCNAEFSGPPNRRYCDDHRPSVNVPRHKRMRHEVSA